MRFAAAVLVLTSIFSARAGAQSVLATMTADDTSDTSRMIASGNTGKSLPVVQPLTPANTTVNEPPAESVILVTVIKPRAEQPHRFIDRTNSLAFAALAGSLTADALSTQKGLAYPRFHEMNPLARPFVQSRTGAAFYTAGSFALLGSGMYLAHKTNHHKLEKVTPFLISGWEAFLAARNYHLISKVNSTH
jgi:hypothetical protein